MHSKPRLSFLKRTLSKLPAAIASLILCSAASAQTNCNADISGDGVVAGDDLAAVLTNWGVCQANPTISGVYPASGPREGGTAIAIVGADLGRTTSVTIDGVLAPQFEVVSATVVTAVTPAGTTGSRAVVLRDKQGQQIAASTFTYVVVDLPWATVLEQVPSSAVVSDAILRNAIIATGLPWRVRDNGTKVEMLLIPPGLFDMGCSPSISAACHFDEFPVHEVSLTKPFYLGRFELTQSEWLASEGANPSYFQGASYPNWQQRPVESVSWNAALDFCGRNGLRLPTEAEWEFACRAGTSTAFHGWADSPNGTNEDALIGTIAWTTWNAGSQTNPVGLKPSNGLGLHDMLGNVMEWVADWHDPWYYASSPLHDPPGPDTSPTGYRVLRGGSFVNFSTFYLRSSRRGLSSPSNFNAGFGFRVARNP